MLTLKKYEYKQLTIEQFWFKKISYGKKNMKLCCMHSEMLTNVFLRWEETSIQILYMKCDFKTRIIMEIFLFSITSMQAY